MIIEIINGPNLNLLGRREPEKYGHSSFEDYLLILKSRFPDIDFNYFQSNLEGEIIEEIQRSGYTIYYNTHQIRSSGTNREVQEKSNILSRTKSF